MIGRRVNSVSCGFLLMLMCAGPCPAWAHAFPTRSQPRVGGVVDHAPRHVHIWFDDELAKRFSRLYVNDAHGKRVSRGKGHVVGKDDKQLEADLPSLPAGKYHVYWRTVGRDGHHTRGDFTFTVKKP